MQWSHHTQRLSESLSVTTDRAKGRKADTNYQVVMKKSLVNLAINLKSPSIKIFNRSSLAARPEQTHRTVATTAGNSLSKEALRNVNSIDNFATPKLPESPKCYPRQILHSFSNSIFSYSQEYYRNNSGNKMAFFFFPKRKLSFETSILHSDTKFRIKLLLKKYTHK